MKKVYKLERDFNHSGDSERDAFHVPFEGNDNISYYMSDTEMYNNSLLPKQIFFQANFQQIPDYDYPFTDLNIPVMSMRMLSAILSVKTISYELIPVIMIDDTYLGKRLDANDSLVSTVPIIENYVAIRLTDGLLNYLDMILLHLLGHWVKGHN